MTGVPLPPKPPYKPFTVAQEYRFVGGKRHGQVELLEDARELYESPTPEILKSWVADGEIPSPQSAVVTYRRASFGSSHTRALRLDVMLAEELNVLLAGDPRHPDVAWAVLDAFMIDIPNARAADEKSSMARCKRAIIEARAALKRARFALPKVAVGLTENAVAWFVEDATARCDMALDHADGVDRSALRAEEG